MDDFKGSRTGVYIIFIIHGGARTVYLFPF